MKALFHRLHGVAKVPMRSEGAESIERRETIKARKFRHIDQRRVRITRLDEQEHIQALFCPAWRIRRRIDGVSIIRVWAYRYRDQAVSRGMPDISQVRCNGAREEILVRRREYRDASSARARGDCSISYGE